MSLKRLAHAELQLQELHSFLCMYTKSQSVSLYQVNEWKSEEEVGQDCFKLWLLQNRSHMRVPGALSFSNFCGR